MAKAGPRGAAAQPAKRLAPRIKPSNVRQWKLLPRRDCPPAPARAGLRIAWFIVSPDVPAEELKASRVEEGSEAREFPRGLISEWKDTKSRGVRLR